MSGWPAPGWIPPRRELISVSCGSRADPLEEIINCIDAITGLKCQREQYLGNQAGAQHVLPGPAGPLGPP